MFKTKLATALTVTTLFAASATAQTIVDVAAGDERFSTLVAAVEAAGLTETLSGPGPFTVFAPVNEAFAALPEGTVEALLQPENQDQLTAVLLYHVDDRALTSDMLQAGQTPIRPMLEDARLCMSVGEEGVTIADSTSMAANVVIADLETDNGVIHVIDKVLLPGDTYPDCH